MWQGIFPPRTLLPHLSLAQNSQNNRTQTARTEMTFNISCCSKLKIYKKFVVYKESQYRSPSLGSPPPPGGRGQKGE